MPRLGFLLLPGLGIAAAAACGDDGPASTGSGGASTASMAVATTGAAGGGSTVTSSATGSAGGSSLPSRFTVRGVVVDADGPVAGASVLQGGGDVQQVTGDDGAFEVELTTDLPGIPTLVAAKIGHRAAGKEIYEVPAEALELTLLAAEPPDNEGYIFGDPGNGNPVHDDSTAYCGHCHTTFVATFQGSGHQDATSDPWVQDLYAGVATAHGDEASCEAAGGTLRPGKVPGTVSERAPRCYVGDGALPDLNDCGAPGARSCDDPDAGPEERPSQFGRCADCHAAGMDGPAGGRDLLEATGIGFEQGNHCDACHHVSDIDLDAPPGTGGRLVMQRPRERVTDEPGAAIRQVMFGPLLDVPNGFMGGSFQPKFMEAAFCAGCHEQRQEALLPGASLDPERWPDGLPTHSTFSEWSASTYGETGFPCQGCHMPPIFGMFNSVDVAEPETAGLASGFARPAERNRSHAFVGALQGAPRMIDIALTMTLSAVPGATPGTIDVTVALTNFGAGHAVPTGETLRSLLLVLEVDACGGTVIGVEGSTIADTGGTLARGTVGDDVQIDGTWPAGAERAERGHRVRVTRPTGDFLDYPGVGRFADPSLSAEAKGIPVQLPVADVEVMDVVGDVLVTSPPLDLQEGDVVWLGEGADLREGAPARALAGMPGQDFARITVDPSGRRHVPHHAAVDIASDHRVPPSGEVVSAHVLALPDACLDATVTATLLYRRAPLQLARERGWDLVEHVVTSSVRRVTLR